MRLSEYVEQYVKLMLAQPASNRPSPLTRLANNLHSVHLGRPKSAQMEAYAEFDELGLGGISSEEKK